MGKKGISKYDGQFSVGQMFGQWKITDDKIVLQKEAKIKCVCTGCNTQHIISVCTVLSGKSKSCYPCSAKKKFGKNNPFWRGVGEIPAMKYRTAVTPEERKALAETWEECGGKCALTGWNISIIENTASPDRIDSSKGYVKDNIQWVHKNVNISKNMFDQDHFITMCHAIASRFDNPNQLKNTRLFGI